MMDAESQQVEDLKAEIERLKDELVVEEGALRGLGALCQQKDKLITELCDALHHYGFDGILEPDPQKYDTETYLLDLIQRGREATR
jgi:hypothetical protein